MNRIHRRLAALLLLLPFLTAAEKQSHVLTGKIVHIADGDTVTVLDAEKTQHKIRLLGIDAPESHQAFGQQAKKAISEKISEKEVKVLWHSKDKYGRTLGDIYLDKRWINKEMVADGFAWHYKHYSKDKTLADAEIEARNAKRGLWQDAHPIPPWEYRRTEAERRKERRQEPTPVEIQSEQQ